MGIGLHLISDLDSIRPPFETRSDTKALCQLLISDDTGKHLHVLEGWFWIGLAPLRKVASQWEPPEPGDYSDDSEEDQRLRDAREAFVQAWDEAAWQTPEVLIEALTQLLDVLQRMNEHPQLFETLERMRAPLARNAFKERCHPDLYVEGFIPPPPFDDPYFTLGWFAEDVEDVRRRAQWYKDHGATCVQMFAA